MIECIPNNDTQKRFLLGEGGRKELLAIGLNPSTANEITLDPTSRNIQTIAKNNDCDGWWLVNLYPLRTSNPKKLPKIADKELIEKNQKFIEQLFSNPKYNIHKVLCCWGNSIENHLYLEEQARIIKNKIVKKLYSIGKTMNGNPYHPAPMTVNRYLGGINNVKLIKYSWNLNIKTDWSQNWGGDDFPKGKAIWFGNNIYVEKGYYEITLDLLKKSYKFKKLK